VPSWGGNSLGGVCPGQRDQDRVERRPDVLVFTGEPLEEDLHVVGHVKAVLWAASSAKDTDFTVKVCDVHPDGRSYNVVDGIVRASHRDGGAGGAFLLPGEATRFEIDCWATATTFLKGHRIRVQVSSSNFPRFDRNLNTGAPHGSDAVPVIATQRVLHTPERPSHVLLPVVAKP
jgi:hypothetical protein